MYLLNDIPWIPLHALDRIETIKPGGWDMRESAANCTDIEMVSKADVDSGAVKVWTSTPISYTEDYKSIVAFKLMQHLGIYELRDALHAEHWIFKSAPDYEDLDFSWTVTNPQGSVDIRCELGRCTTHLADKVEVKVHSKTDPLFQLQHSFEGGWVMVPDDPDDLYDYGDVHLHCYEMPGLAHCCDEPVAALGYYMDDYNHFVEEQYETARSNWTKVLRAMRGESLADLVEDSLYELEHLGEKQLDEMCLVLVTTRTELPEDAHKAPEAHVMDLKDSDFWRMVARTMEPAESDAWIQEFANSIQLAVLSAAKQTARHSADATHS